MPALCSVVCLLQPVRSRLLHCHRRRQPRACPRLALSCLHCQFNPRLGLPTSPPSFLISNVQCATAFLSYGLCALGSVNLTACDSAGSTPPMTLSTALHSTACSADPSLLPLIETAITTVQARNTTVSPMLTVNGLPCTGTPARVFSACLGLDVNTAVNSSALDCPSMACAEAYTAYASCYAAQHSCPSSDADYSPCPDFDGQIAGFLSSCHAAVLRHSFTGYLQPPPTPPPPHCNTTTLALYVEYVEPTLPSYPCSLDALFSSLSAAVEAVCFFSPLLPYPAQDQQLLRSLRLRIHPVLELSAAAVQQLTGSAGAGRRGAVGSADGGDCVSALAAQIVCGLAR